MWRVVISALAFGFDKLVWEIKLVRGGEERKRTTTKVVVRFCDVLACIRCGWVLHLNLGYRC